MIVLIPLLLLTALVGTAVVRTGEPHRQAITLSAFGLVLSLLFLAFQAPDVALSQVAIGSAVLPLMVLLTVHTVRSKR